MEKAGKAYTNSFCDPNSSCCFCRGAGEAVARGLPCHAARTPGMRALILMTFLILRLDSLFASKEFPVRTSKNSLFLCVGNLAASH
jgi:hypothetical protein